MKEGLNEFTVYNKQGRFKDFGGPRHKP